MNTELINEFYLLQQSRSNAKYLEILEERIYTPLKKANRKANKEVTSWMNKSGRMVMNLESMVNRSIKRLKNIIPLKHQSLK